MNVEQTLTDELATVARSVVAPPPPAAADLVREAERSRSRVRRGWSVTIVLSAAAVIVAVVAGTQLGRHDAAPQPTHPTRDAVTFPVGAPLHTYVDPTTGALYIGGVAVRGNGWVEATTFDDLTLGYLGAPDTGDVAVFVGRQRVGTIHPQTGSQVEVAPGRRTIAWVEVHGASGSIVVAGVSTDGLRQLGRLTLDTLARQVDDETREQLLGVDDDGTVTYGGLVGGHSWRAGGTPKPADISAYTYGPAGFPDRAQDVQVNPSGSWGAWLTSPRDPGAGGGEASWSAVTFQQPGRPETRARIVMPAQDDDVRSLYWESDTDFVLATFTGNQFVHEVHEYLRCNVLTRACEVAPGWGDH